MSQVSHAYPLCFVFAGGVLDAQTVWQAQPTPALIRGVPRERNLRRDPPWNCDHTSSGDH
jgi:hypothetical protein